MPGHDNQKFLKLCGILESKRRPAKIVDFPQKTLSVQIFIKPVAITRFFEYTRSEQIACRSSRLEYDERVCLASASDGVLQSVEYRLLVGKSLPQGPQTKPRNRHGLHYIKMFPVTKQYLVRYRTEGNAFATLIQAIIDRNSKQIVEECQQYLDLYGQGMHPDYSTDIDFLLQKLNDV